MFGEPYELYNLAADPQENENLYGIADFRDIAQQLDNELDAFFLLHATPEYDPWRGGTGKALLMYSDKNDRFIEEIPDWHPPSVEMLTPFSDSRP